MNHPVGTQNTHTDRTDADERAATARSLADELLHEVNAQPHPGHFISLDTVDQVIEWLRDPARSSALRG
ncbi:MULTISPECIES: hypothetical protein [unclassified Streptomyces]|uniref:hypothetical protein n=1 Tax=unclassified Streptomyces TaxID=2593676 RepID=UPI000BF10068|nr:MULTISPECIES: hypothetical protein [unclassified Streptomyces]